MLSPTTRMDADTRGGSTDDIDYNKCPQRDGTEEACTPPVDKQNISMVNQIQGSNQSTVNESTACGVLIKEQNIREQHVHTEPSDGVTYSTAVKDKIRISVPTVDGTTIVEAKCVNNKMFYLCYEQDDGQVPTFGSTWIFKNVPDGIMGRIMRDGEFTEFKYKLTERFRCKLKKMHNKSCLVLEFLHDTEEDRDRMMQDQEKVKTMFMEFLHGIKKDAPSCSLEVRSEPATANISDIRERDNDKKEAADLPPQPLTKDPKERLGKIQ